REAAIHQDDLVLKETGEQVIGAFIGDEGEAGDDLDIVDRAAARPEAPGDLLPPRKPEAVEKIEVEGVADLAEIRFMAIGAVVVSLNLNVAAFSERSFPAAHDIAAGKERVGVYGLRERSGVAGGLDALAGFLVVEIALEREG